MKTQSKATVSPDIEALQSLATLVKDFTREAEHRSKLTSEDEDTLAEIVERSQAAWKEVTSAWRARPRPWSDRQFGLRDSALSERAKSMVNAARQLQRFTTAVEQREVGGFKFEEPAIASQGVRFRCAELGANLVQTIEAVIEQVRTDADRSSSYASSQSQGIRWAMGEPVLKEVLSALMQIEAAGGDDWETKSARAAIDSALPSIVKFAQKAAARRGENPPEFDFGRDTVAKIRASRSTQDASGDAPEAA